MPPPALLFRRRRMGKFICYWAGNWGNKVFDLSLIARTWLIRQRQIHDEETYDAVFIIAFFVVQHTGVISVLQDNEFMGKRRDPEQLAGRRGEHGLVRRFEIHLGDARKFCDSRFQRLRVPKLRIEPAENQLRHSGDEWKRSETGAADLQGDHFAGLAVR